ncbi:Uma2 family endonuclease [Candidatus Thiothrix sp. Deng01]|uniref:Uma2 family endonuclease n=1 Tax=Candidatus Thiothrix phosphatis TaxID=3112415 RepID=A0ABU6CXR6_9GAMM|nr:Uma2 family endonuclease [Candidatus Thiothrix sp. Deng01]MEB4590898.1 Uma2 family endonuclease [Candidatus Thiothrix sp. Deng01]
MASTAEKLDYITVEEYLAGEEGSEIKHEYVDGQIYAMAGGSLKHNLIASNISGLLWNHLRGQPCFPLSSDMLVKTLGKRFRYPDVVVVCENDSSEDEQVMANPILIVEVLSKSTRKKDKGEKRLEYLAIPSLLEYVLIEQDFAEVEVQRRSVGWQSAYYFLGDEVVLESVNASIAVEAIYERVTNEDMLVWLEQKTG